MERPFLSKIICGCMSWGQWGKRLNTIEMQDLLSHCIENGITTFDHADIYGDYTTEIEFGKALISSSINREEIQLITKCGIEYVGKTRTNKTKHYNYSRDYIIWSVENSLRNLRTDYVDVLLLHRPSPLMLPEEIAEAVVQLRSQGKIKQFGVSNFNTSQVKLISSFIDIEYNQIEYSLSQNSAQWNGILDQMMEKQIVPMAWSPLGSIFKTDSDQSRNLIEAIDQLAKKYNATKGQVLLSWIMKHPSKIHPVIGTTNYSRIINATKSVGIKLELEDWFYLLEASEGRKVP